MILNLVDKAKLLAKSKLNSVDYAIDATLGNGKDSLFLTNLLNEGGYVFAFELQNEAIESSKKLFIENGVEDKVKIFNVGHENMSEYIPESARKKVDVIFFNLGWLPNSDKSVITNKDTTLKALESSLDLLKEGGVLSVLSYRGHMGGEDEFQAVKSFFAQNLKEYEVFGNEENPRSPILFFHQASGQ